jgi:hypothetical protein
MDGTDTKIIEAQGGRPFAHGIYPGMIPTSVLATLGVTIAHKYVIIWAREQHGLYPTMSQYRANPLMSLNGGVAADPDYVVATYALYKKTAVFQLVFWADFDHWPMEGASLKAGLADGHYHPGKKTSDQLPLNDLHRDLMLKIVHYVRFGVF